MLRLRANTLFRPSNVMSIMDRRSHRFLMSFGGFTRITARRSIRKRRGVSEPGNPPHSHTDRLRSAIFFAADHRRRNVVIGPLLGLRAFRRDGRPRTGTVPETIEYGGDVAFQEVQTRNGQHWFRPRSRADTRGRRTRKRYVKYEPRPFMTPAFDKAKRQQARFWEHATRH